jgi:hypothetical protein
VSKVTQLASASITPTDMITVELVQAEETPAVVIIKWPDKPTVLHMRKLAEAMATACRVLANASTELSRIKARKR